MKYLLTVIIVLFLTTSFSAVVVAKTKQNEATIGKVEKVNGNKIKVGLTDVEMDAKTKVVGKKVKLNAKVAVISEEGTKSGKVKKAVKVYVKEATAAGQLKRHAVQGVITAVSGNVITLSHQIQRDRTYKVVVDKATVIKSKNLVVDISSLVVGQRIVAVGLPTVDGLTAKLIHVIPGKAKGVFKKFPVSTSSGEATKSGETATESATPTP